MSGNEPLGGRSFGRGDGGIRWVTSGAVAVEVAVGRDDGSPGLCMRPAPEGVEDASLGAVATPGGMINLGGVGRIRGRLAVDGPVGGGMVPPLAKGLEGCGWMPSEPGNGDDPPMEPVPDALPASRTFRVPEAFAVSEAELQILIRTSDWRSPSFLWVL